MRRLLEGPAAEMAAGRMDSRQLAPLRVEAEFLARAEISEKEWTERWSEFDEEFHTLIASSCGNERLMNDIFRYRLIHKGFNRMRTDYSSLQSALAEHVEILDALERSDGAGARAAMEKHISNWQGYFVRSYAEVH